MGCTRVISVNTLGTSANLVVYLGRMSDFLVHSNHLKLVGLGRILVILANKLALSVMVVFVVVASVVASVVDKTYQVVRIGWMAPYQMN